MAEMLAPSTRHKFVHNGQVIYEWDQTLEEVNIYIQVPPGVPSRRLVCDIKTSHLTVGITGNPPYLNHNLGGCVITDSSFWTIEDGVLHVTLQKLERGAPWTAAIEGHGTLDPLSADKEQKRLLLERFQREHPGFDFSQAEFSGQCPNPRTFLGGISNN